MGSGRAENNAACRITNYTVQRRQGSRPLLVAAERERGRLLFVLFVDYTNNVRRPAKRREEKECGGGKVRDEEWERAGIKRSRYKAGY